MEIRNILSSLDKELRRNVPPPMNAFMAVVKQNLGGLPAVLKEKEGTDRYEFVDPACPGHTIGRKQAGIARSLPKALIEMIIEEALHKGMNMDDWLLTTGTSITQQHSTLTLNAVIKSGTSHKGKGARKGIGAKDAKAGSGWCCPECAAPTETCKIYSCNSCEYKGFPVAETGRILVCYRGCTWELHEDKGWLIDGTTAEVAGLRSTYEVDVSALAERPPEADVIVGPKDACDFPLDRVRRGATMNDKGDLVEDAVEPPTTAFSPFLIMQKDAIDAVAKKIESLPPSQSAATDGADTAEAKREPVPANQGAATHGADNAKGKGKAAGGAASSWRPRRGR